MLLVILKVKKLLEYFMKKELQKTNQQEFRIKNSNQEKRIDKKDLIKKMSQYFPKP